MNDVTKKNNKRTLIILLLVFGLPVVLAKFALEYDWFNKAATNKGELIEPTLDFSSLNTNDSKKWRIVYVLPEDCDAKCENAIYSLNQIWVASGKESDRVESVVVATETSHKGKLEEVKENKNLVVLSVNEQNVKNVFKQTSTDGIFLTDTLDNVILRYPLQEEQQQAVLFSRDILADLRKLLKLSRIG